VAGAPRITIEHVSLLLRHRGGGSAPAGIS